MSAQIPHNESGEKWCGGCQRWKPLEQFHTRRAYWDGRASWCKRCAKASEVKRRYGLTLERYEEILAEGCWICGDPAKDLDHDHATGRVRAGLCKHCNKGLGLFRDDPKLMARAIGYLQEYRA